MLDARAELGECPVWSVAEQALYWVDIRAPALHRLDPATGATRTWPMPSRIGSFGLRESGGAVVALVDGFHLLDFDTGELTFLAGPEHVPGTRFNDGKVSPGRPVLRRHDGRGAARPARSPRCTGSTRTGSLHRVVERPHRLQRSGLDRGRPHDVPLRQQGPGDLGLRLRPAAAARSSGPPGGRPADRGAAAGPDGAATDEQGYYWSAGHLGGRAQPLVARRPAGPVSIPLPCSNPTAPCFGGPDLQTIFVTSLRHDLPAGGARRQAAVRRDLRRPGRRAGRADQPRSAADPTTQSRRRPDAERLHGRPRNDGRLALRGAAAASTTPSCTPSSAAPQPPAVPQGPTPVGGPQAAVDRGVRRAATATRSGPPTSARRWPTPRSTS